MSTLIFNADEVFEIAKRIERRGVAFYRAAATHMPDEATVQLMRSLADMEAQHEATFKQMQDALSETEKAEILQDPHGDAFDFLRGMADGYVFDLNEDPIAFLDGKPSGKSILNKAIEREAESVAFYTCIRSMVSAKHGQGRILEIIQQEMGHIAQLSKELSKCEEK